MKFLVVVAVLLGSYAHRIFAQQESVMMDRLQLMNHSFESPLTADTTLSEWNFGGGAVPTRTGVVIVPGIGGRNGQFWHKSPLQTNHFEIEFQFTVTGPGDLSLSQGFAFWYTEDPPSLGAGNKEELASYSFFGNKNPFKGFAVFFSLFDRENFAKSSISASLNDGNQIFDIVAGVPTEYGIYFSQLRNSPQPLVFKLSVNPNSGIQGQIRLINSTEWLDAFNLSNVNLSAGGYVGFSASTPPLPAEKNAERISIDALRIYNLDMSKPGEDSKIVNDTLKGVEVENLLSEDRHAREMPDVAAELKQLSRLLFKLISEQSPRETMIMRSLATLQSNVETLTDEVRTLQTKLDVGSVPQKESHEVVHRMTNELQGLRNLFHSQSKHQENMQQSLSTLQKTMSNGPSNIAEFAERSSALEATIKQQASFSSWMIFGLIIMIALFAIFMWKRMRDMEKKHFL